MTEGFLFQKTDKVAKIWDGKRVVEVPLSQLPKGAEELHGLQMDGNAPIAIIPPHAPSQKTTINSAVGPGGNGADSMGSGIPHPADNFANGGANTGTDGGNTTSPKNRQQYAMQKLTSLGWTPAQAAGVVGRFMQESFHDLRTGAVGDAGISLGVGQWNKERRTALVNFAKEKKTSPLSLDTQLEFFDHEIRNSPAEKLAFKTLSAAESPEQAAAAMMHYERPRGYTVRDPARGHGYSNTVRNAASVLTAYDPNAVISTPGDVPGGDLAGADSVIEPPSRRGQGQTGKARARGGFDYTPPDLSGLTNLDLGVDEAVAEGRRRIDETIASGLRPQAAVEGPDWESGLRLYKQLGEIFGGR